MNAPFSAPAEVPTIRSGTIPRSYRARSMPTWIAPRLAPPERTKAVDGHLLMPICVKPAALLTVGGKTDGPPGAKAPMTVIDECPASRSRRPHKDLAG